MDTQNDGLEAPFKYDHFLYLLNFLGDTGDTSF